MHEITFNLRRPINPETGEEWDQTADAAKNMRYAHSLRLPEIKGCRPRMGRAVIVGGGHTITQELDNIKKLAADPDNAVFALNNTHNWLIERGVIPDGCVLFEIDVEPAELFVSANKATTYYICSHCHQKTFDQLADYKRVLWHSQPNSPIEAEVSKEIFPGAIFLGGGIGTFLRTISVSLALGFRNFDVFGCDSSFPDDATSTHVEGYRTINDVGKDTIEIFAKPENSEVGKKYKTVGYLAYQVEEFKAYCHDNHRDFALRVHGDTLLRYVHETIYPDQYTPL